MIQQLIDANVRFLSQASELLDAMDQTTYARRQQGLSSVGAHLRHIIDHYTAFAEGAASGQVDYDDRQRDRQVEEDLLVAIGAVRNTVNALQSMDVADDAPLQVKIDDGGPATPWSTSSVQRELQFLVSHTVHHFALIKVVLRDTGIPLHEHFGIAPSTLAYESGPACAP